MMKEICSECGAKVMTGATCQDNFHALLYREAEVGKLFPNYFATSEGQRAHFFAITCYAIQHPISMQYRIEALFGARENMENLLSGQASIGMLLTKVREKVEGQGRVLRRETDPIHNWGVIEWRITVSDILAAPVESYAKATTLWASAVLDATKSTAHLLHRSA